MLFLLKTKEAGDQQHRSVTNRPPEKVRLIQFGGGNGGEFNPSWLQPTLTGTYPTYNLT